MHALPRPDWRAVVVAVAALVAVAAVLAAPGLVRDDLGDALGTIAEANPLLLWLAAACFVTLIVTMGLAWRSGVQALGGDTSRADAAARFGAGSLTSALIPAGAGGAVRIGLFSRVLPPPDRLWRAGGISAAVTAARALALSVLIAIAYALGALPLWPIAIFLGIVAVAVAVALVMRGREAHSHVTHLFDVFAVLGRSPGCAVKLFAWTAAALVARTTAATIIVAAMGLPEPVLTGLVAIAALSIAGSSRSRPATSASRAARSPWRCRRGAWTPTTRSRSASPSRPWRRPPPWSSARRRSSSWPGGVSPRGPSGSRAPARARRVGAFGLTTLLL